MVGCQVNTIWHEEFVKDARWALLFVIAVELMACDIISNPSIKGLNLSGYNRKICQYANDATTRYNY